jgi:hypothetical protein
MPYFGSFVCNAQTISLTGQQFNNWNNDIDLAPSISGVLYTATNVTLVPGSQISGKSQLDK